MGLPIPGIFVFVENDTQLQLVVDGQQRLLSVFGYFDGRFPGDKLNRREFMLKGVDARWAEKQFTDLTITDQRRLQRAVLRVVVIEQSDPDDDTSLYHIFERLNTGGTTLTPQEVRNSSYRGPFNDALIKVNQAMTWRDIFGTNVPDLRMRDVELILRFLALHERLHKYEKPMKEFLNRYMALHQWDSETQQSTEMFLQCACRVVNALGKQPFHVRRGINAAVFDSVMVAFAQCPKTRSDIADRYRTLLADKQFELATTAGTTDVDIVKRRIDLARRILFE